MNTLQFQSSLFPDVTDWLRRLDVSSPKERLAQLKQIPFPQQTQAALEAALRGETQPINDLLFAGTPASTEPSLLIWLAPVDLHGAHRFAWMVGEYTSVSEEIRNRFSAAAAASSADTLLLNRCSPPALVFVDPKELSIFEDSLVAQSASQTPSIDDFAIFQTAHRPGAVTPINDLDQRMALNADLIQKGVIQGLRRARQLFRFRGNLAAIEEFRACLCAIRWGAHLQLSYSEEVALACSVFFSRFLHYGLRSFRQPQKTRQRVREITVGLLFFESLCRAHAMTELDSDSPIIHLEKVLPAMHAALEELHQQEASARLHGKSELRQIAYDWYSIAYPNRQLSSSASALYAACVINERQKGGELFGKAKRRTI